MTTTRIDHTHCTHDRTPRGRAFCRTRRNDAVRAAQVAYMALDLNASFDVYENYAGLVGHVAFTLGIDVRDAYRAVENGPVIS